VALGDFNGDGQLDVASGLSHEGGFIRTWLNNGDGAAGVTNGFSFAHDAAMAAGDFDDDGRADLVVRTDTSMMSILAAGAGGQFTEVTNIPAPGNNYQYSRTVAVGDFNRDGRPDIAFVGTYAIGVLLNQTPPALTASRVADHVQIIWPADFGVGFALEYSTNPVTGWLPFPTPPVTISNRNGVADFPYGNKFYRLRHP
jgi:hypothetical protein